MTTEEQIAYYGCTLADLKELVAMRASLGFGLNEPNSPELAVAHAFLEEIDQHKKLGLGGTIETKQRFRCVEWLVEHAQFNPRT